MKDQFLYDHILSNIQKVESIQKKKVKIKSFYT